MTRASPGRDAPCRGGGRRASPPPRAPGAMWPSRTPVRDSSCLVLGSWVGAQRFSTFPYSQPRPALCYPKILVPMLTRPSEPSSPGSGRERVSWASCVMQPMGAHNLQKKRLWISRRRLLGVRHARIAETPAHLAANCSPDPHERRTSPRSWDGTHTARRSQRELPNAGANAGASTDFTQCHSSLGIASAARAD